MTENKKPEWIITPGLYGEVKSFERLVSLIGDKPIIITGPTGVGKSLFTHIFKCILIEKGFDSSKIRTINCASFNEKLLESELFGHIKGAFTDAISDKEGHIAKANGGALILEEVGELSKPIQAKLLTFIEDHYYYRVGDTKREEADVRIIGTTNKPKIVFREDFWNRLFPFYVSAIYERRRDILYYLNFLHPDIIPRLWPWEVMALLCYNWPGNVREIDRIGQLIKWHKREDPPKRSKNSRLRRNPMLRSQLKDSPIEKGYSDLKVDRIAELNADLKRSRVDVVLLEKVLKAYRLSLDPKRTTKRAFYDIDNYKYSVDSDLEKKYSKKKYSKEDIVVKTSLETKAFDECLGGVHVYTELFFKGESLWTDQNLLDFDVDQKDMLIPREWGALDMIENSTEKHKKLEKEIFEYRVGKKIPKRFKRIPDPDTPKFRYLLKSLNVGRSKKSRSITSMTWEELRFFYHEELLKKTRGNMAAAARIAKVNRKTFTWRIKENLGIDPEEFK